jgi:hypothetical protein
LPHRVALRLLRANANKPPDSWPPFGKLRNAGPLSVRVMPLLGAAFLIVFDVAFAIGNPGMITCVIEDLTPPKGFSSA